MKDGVGGILGDVDGRRGRQRSVSSGKCGRIIEAVADHQCLVALRLQRFDRLQLLIRANFGGPAFDAASDGCLLDGIAPVTRQHADHVPGALEFRNAGARVLPRFIDEVEADGRFACGAVPDRCLAIAGANPSGGAYFFFDTGRGRDETGTGDFLHVVDGWRANALLAGRFHKRLRIRMPARSSNRTCTCKRDRIDAAAGPEP